MAMGPREYQEELQALGLLHVVTRCERAAWLPGIAVLCPDTATDVDRAEILHAVKACLKSF